MAAPSRWRTRRSPIAVGPELLQEPLLLLAQANDLVGGVPLGEGGVVVVPVAEVLAAALDDVAPGDLAADRPVRRGG